MNVKITTLTPLFIGSDSGSHLSPYSDYVWENKQFHYVSSEKLEKYLTREMTDEWVEKMKKSINNTRIEYSLLNFIHAHSIPLDNISIRSVPMDIDPQRKLVKKFISTSGRPFIPGSSLKGAMRTAVLYSRLKETDEGRRQLDSISKKVKQFKNSVNQKEKTDIIKQLSCENMERAIFGMPHKDPFTNIHVGDSETLNLASLFIASIYRFNLKTQKSDAPMWTETLPKDTECNCRINILPNSSDTSFMQKIGNWKELCRMLNAFSRASLEREIDQLPLEKFDEIVQIYNKLLVIMQQLTPGQAIMRLGQGKTIFDNTFLMLIEHDPIFFPLREMLKLGKSPKSQNISKGKFPVTRSFIANNGVPVNALGWIIIKGEV